MDPLTQGIVATSVTQNFSPGRKIVIVSIIAFLSGLAPDIDVFIRSNTDPLLFLEYHRHFTHSLFFIPIGGLICSLLFYFIITKRYNFSFKETYIYSTIGYATHGIIDSFTTYGTQLMWPYTNERFAWNMISVIDPMFTIPVIIFVLFAIFKKKRKYSIYALVWMISYLTLGLIQKERAEDIINDYAVSNGHKVTFIEAKPSFANIIVWKVIYSDSLYFYVNAIKLGLTHKIIPGERIKKINLERDFKWLDLSSQQATDLERFKWFSNGYLGISSEDNNIIYDIRFSTIPNQVQGLWGIKLNKNKKYDEHVEYITNRGDSFDRFNELIEMIIN